MIQKLNKEYALIWARGVWLLGQSRWRNSFQKQSFPDSKLGVLKNFVDSIGKHLCWSLFSIKLQTCNSIEKRLQNRCFPVKFAKFLRTPFFTKEFQWLLLRFDSCFQRRSKQKPVQLSAIITTFRWKKVFAAAKIQKQLPYMFSKRRPIRARTNLFLWILRNF